jgi:hypothetical protein
MADKTLLNEQETARLVRGLQAQAGEPDSRHLGDEDILHCASDELAAADRPRIDTHLSACQECRDEVAHVRETLRTFETAEGRARLDRLWSGFQAAAADHVAAESPAMEPAAPHAAAARGGSAGLSEQLREWASKAASLCFPAPMLGQPVTAAGSVVAAGATEDMQLEWKFSELANGDLEGVFASTSEELAGATLTLSTDPARDVVLTKVFGTSLMGRLVIPKDEWRACSGRMIDRVTFADGEVVAFNDDDDEGPSDVGAG